MHTWQQVNVTFPDWGHAEEVAATRIVPVLAASRPDCWWFIRKSPCWRIRYQPESPRIERQLDALTEAGHIDGWSKVVYEPEIHAFGGPEAMTTAHRLFHADSRGVLDYVRDPKGGRHRREISLLLCSVMMRAANQDQYEQGDVWARVADHRTPLPGASPCGPSRTAVRRFLTVDAELLMRTGAALEHCASWASAYTTAGRDLATLTATGRLHRGLRSILAHHVIFAWNRLGLPYQTQVSLAGRAKTAIFGPDLAPGDA